MKDSFLLSFRRHRNESGREILKIRIQLLSVLSVGWFPRGATIPVAPQHNSRRVHKVVGVSANTIGVGEFPELVNLAEEYDLDLQLLHNALQLPNVYFPCTLYIFHLQASMQRQDSSRPSWVARPSQLLRQIQCFIALVPQCEEIRKHVSKDGNGKIVKFFAGSENV